MLKSNAELARMGKARLRKPITSEISEAELNKCLFLSPNSIAWVWRLLFSTSLSGDSSTWMLWFYGASQSHHRVERGIEIYIGQSEKRRDIFNTFYNKDNKNVFVWDFLKMYLEVL